MASEPEWRDEYGDGNTFNASLPGGTLDVYDPFRNGKWEMQFPPVTGIRCRRLAATTAHDAKVEALDRVLEWTVKLSAEAGRLKGRTEAEGES